MTKKDKLIKKISIAICESEGINPYERVTNFQPQMTRCGLRIADNKLCTWLAWHHFSKYAEVAYMIINES